MFDTFDNVDPVDSFGNESPLGEFWFDGEFSFKIELSESVAGQVETFLEFKFGFVPQCPVVYLCWTSGAEDGIGVHDVFDDAEQTWSMMKEHFFKTFGRQIVRRIR